ncbi:MAG: GNAT family N-acetyltransferase [Bacteroidales bacterium]|nr:GNAT family N-acetyltransferase [Bacteroidales bacterium]
MLKINVINNVNEIPGGLNRDKIVDFLFVHLDQFGDTKSAINKCLDYAFSDEKGEGGFVLTAHVDDQLVGALIMNFSGMSEYIPENVLVYIAVHRDYRGKGYGREIIEKAFELCDGDVKLHVEYDNPAKRLYERIGFVNKYAEMRYKNS